MLSEAPGFGALRAGAGWTRSAVQSWKRFQHEVALTPMQTAAQRRRRQRGLWPWCSLTLRRQGTELLCLRAEPRVARAAASAEDPGGAAALWSSCLPSPLARAGFSVCVIPSPGGSLLVLVCRAPGGFGTWVEARGLRGRQCQAVLPSLVFFKARISFLSSFQGGLCACCFPLWVPS